MANSIIYSLRPLEPVFADADFLNEFEDHIPYLLRSIKVTTAGVTPSIGLRYKGDFAGLMDEMGYPAYMVYPNMRLNGFINSLDYDGNQLQFQVLDMNYYTQMARSWLTQRRTRSR